MNPERYKLDCVCRRTVEIATAVRRCPHCGAALQIEWGALQPAEPRRRAA